jgi:phospholipase/carboxylesterase
MELLYTAHVPAGDGPFPTVLALHGWGASAHDLIGLAGILHGGEALVLCPQGPVAFPIGQGIHGYGWWPLAEDGQLDAAVLEQARGRVRRFFDQACERYPIDRRKVVAMGFSQGGVMATDLVLQDPRRFTGLIALSTWLPDAVDRSAPPAEELANLPALLVHGTKDPMVPVELAQDARRKLLALGLNVHYREFEMEHEIRPEALREILVWLEEKAFSVIQLA